MAKRKNGVQSLLGFERFTRYGVKTDKGEVVLFAVEPTNISVMSKANVEIKVHSLMMVLSVIPDLQIIAIDSAERSRSADNRNRQRRTIRQQQGIYAQASGTRAERGCS